MKILEICEFSSGACGVWTRVFSESQEFVKRGHEVIVFSSNLEKGTGKITSKLEETIEGVKIKRFKSNIDKADKFISKNVTYFNFKSDLISLSPDIVITHLIHPHSFKALKICKKLKIPCILVTHAPFNVKRSFPLNFLTYIYYKIKVAPAIKKFSKIVKVTKWETNYLNQLGIKDKDTIYIPNGILDEFFSYPKNTVEKGILFLGRIAPVKNIELLISTAREFPKIKFDIVGPAEPDYLEKINSLAKGLKNIKILPPVYNIKEKISLIDSHKIFILPSWREAMPQGLLEAMARGKIVLASETDGAKEIIKNGKNGFIFKQNDLTSLSELIKNSLKGNTKVSVQAKKEAIKYSWNKLIKNYEVLFNSL